MMPIRESTPAKEGHLHLAKWLTFSILIDPHEMKELIDELSPFFIFITHSMTKKGYGELTKESFLNSYSDYVRSLQQGKVFNELTPFYTSWTLQTDSLYTMVIDNERQLIKSTQPLIQLKPHAIHMAHDATLRSIVPGPQSISWGIQFCYPQIAQNSNDKQIEKALNNDDFANGFFLPSCANGYAAIRCQAHFYITMRF